MIFLEYQVYHGGYLTYTLYLILSVKSSQILVTLYNINPTTHTITSINATVTPNQIFGNITQGNEVKFLLSGRNLTAISNGNVTVATNGVILQERGPNLNETLVGANYPGIASDPFPNLQALAGDRSIFYSTPSDLIMSVILTSILFLGLWELSRSDEG